MRLRITYSLRSKRGRRPASPAGSRAPATDEQLPEHRLDGHRAAARAAGRRSARRASRAPAALPRATMRSKSASICRARGRRRAAGRRARRRSCRSGGSAMPSRAVSRRRNRSGIWIRMPAPSPVLASQPHAPRCSRLMSTCSACSTIACERWPLMCTTKPDAARVVLVARVVEALGGRESWDVHTCIYAPPAPSAKRNLRMQPMRSASGAVMRLGAWRCHPGGRADRARRTLELAIGALDRATVQRSCPRLLALRPFGAAAYEQHVVARVRSPAVGP